MAGGKGGSTTTSVEIPEYIEEAAKRNLARADTISQIGYVPYYGPDVAAFTPTQEAAFQNVAGQAGAFGLTTPAGGAMAGMPAPQEFAGGIQGYSSAPMYEQALGELATRRPAQFNLIESLFINPVTGQVGANVGSPVAPVIDATVPMIDTTSPVISGVGGGGIAALPSVTGDPIADLGIQPNPEIYNAYPEQVQDDIVTLATDPTNIDYDVAFRNVYDYQSEQAESDPYGMSTGVGITPEILEAAGGAESFLPPTQDDFSQSFDRDSSPRPVLRPTQAEDTFGADLYRSLTDPTYDPEGTVVSRALGGLLGDTTSSQPTKLETLGDYVEAAPSMGMTATEAGIAYQQSKGVDDRPFDAFYDTKIKDPISGKTLTPFQLNNRINSPNLGKDYAEAGITSLDQALAVSPQVGASVSKDLPAPPAKGTKIKDPISGKNLTASQLENRLKSPNLGKAYAEAGITNLNELLALAAST